MILKPQSKRSLLEHSLRLGPPTRFYPVPFPRILFVNKYFLALAKSRSLFRYQMHVYNSTVKYSFAGHEYKHFKEVELGFEQDRRLFVMLDPEYLEVVIRSEDPSFEHFKLISLAKGKVGFDCYTHYYEFPPDVLKFFWLRINDLCCRPETLENIDEWALDAQNFDKLCVELIHTDEHMANVLKQNADHLDLSIHDEYIRGIINFGALTRAVHNQVSKSCSLDFWCEYVGQPVSVIEAVASAFQNLEHFSVKTDLYIFYGNDCMVDTFINMLIGYYAFYIRAVACVQKYAQSSNVEMTCDESLERHLELPIDWIDKLKERAGFEDVKHDTYLLEHGCYNETKIWLTQEHGDVKSSFSVRVYHIFVDDLSDYSDSDSDESMGDENE